MQTPIPVEIRRLGSADVSLLRDMLAMMGEAFDERDTYTAAQPDDAYLRRLLGGSHFIAIVATVGTRVVGGLAAYELQKFEQARSEIYIYGLAVHAGHRRAGIATMLIDRLRGVARERGAWVIYVQADPPDAPAVALYTKLGVREDVLHFDIDVT
ncbi:AAC(3)-I family aminoglycoside N-acetyltransferase [Luteimonas kalidii]|uniref:AAC(3)-I family aminoglycoside N-acetyltransferase n=1 Tax=Luteimonas kalidii TaxID=3042025 RepID=A0ABT6JT54_9GAMM|nr:AAC(3)-I family aminoglycoside N-acetyltransferase [Luteimonas kalidii]MDH5833655.1 AAC(3)-I family aminoglycoside N-acetyltransferase [Luteimonas kalidii]